MLTPDQISELHRLHFVEKSPARKISRQMRIGRRTIAKYLNAPAAKAARRDRASKLDPFKPIIAELLQQDPDANAPVIAQRLKPHGYDGGFTIIKDYLVSGAERRGHCGSGGRGHGATGRWQGGARASGQPLG